MSDIKRNPIRVFHRVAGDLDPLGATLTDNDDVAISLTGKTVAFRMIRNADGEVIVDSSAAEIVTAAAGKVQYNPAAGTMDISDADLSSESFSIYWIISEAGEPDLRLPYDGARWQLILHAETDGG